MLRPVKIHHYVSMMQSRGVDPMRVLAGTGVDALRLSDPAYLVNLQQCRSVVSNVIHLTGDQGIGFEMGQHARISDFGVITHAMMSSHTLRQAMQYWLRYSNLVGMLIRLSLHDERDGWTVVFSETEPLGPIFKFCVEEILVTGVTIASMLAGQPVRPSRINLSYPAPLNAAMYHSRFNCPIQFNAPHTSITVREPHADTILPGHNPELNELFHAYCRRVMRQIAGSDTMRARLRSLLLMHTGQLPRLEEAAHSLGMSARTLRRHLQQEGSSYQAVIDEYRFDLASDYLRSQDLAPKEIGFLLGYRDTNAFRRAFKSWSGETILQYRDGLGRGSAPRRVRRSTR